MSTVRLGIFLAILGSVSNNFGILLQKRVVNAVPPEARERTFFRTLTRQPLWLLGVFLQMVFSAACLLAAQYFIGPTLVPGLQGFGLIVLAIGSVKLNNEILQMPEYASIVLLISATVLTGLSGLHIKVSEFDFQQEWFFINALLFSVVIILIFFLLEIRQRKSSLYVKSLLLSMISGLMYVLSDFWTSPLVGTIGEVFNLKANWTQWALFLMASVLLISTNLLAIGKTQLAFKYGPASILIPIRHLPTLVSPLFVYYFVFNLVAPKNYSLWFYLTSIVLIILSSYLLGKQEEQFG
jgi:hypothetical protein